MAVPGTGTLDEVWEDLRRHLDWTHGRPSLIFVTCQSHDDEVRLAERLGVWAARVKTPFVELTGSATELAETLTRLLPHPGVTIAHLPWGPSHQRYAALARLNELRTRLANRDQGALIITGPREAAIEAVHHAADLWAVRSVHRLVRTSPADDTAPAPLTAIDPAAEDRGSLLFPAVGLADPERPPRPATLALLSRAARVAAAADLPSARRLASAAVGAAGDDGPAAVLGHAAAAELAGVAADWPSMHVHLREALTSVQDVVAPHNLLYLIVDVATRYGDLDLAKAATERSLTLRQDLADRIGTPEALRDLSVSLDNVGAVARARGDWDRATTVYERQLELLQDLADRIGTPEALRDLSVSLNNVGAVARARGDWDRAAQLHAQAREIASRCRRASEEVGKDIDEWLAAHPPQRPAGDDAAGEI